MRWTVITIPEMAMTLASFTQPRAVAVTIMPLCFIVQREWEARKITNSQMKVFSQIMLSQKLMFVGCNSSLMLKRDIFSV